MKANQYQCSLCNKIYDLVNDEDWNNEKALKEFERDFGEEKNAKMTMVCNSCYQKIKPHSNPKIYEKYLQEIKTKTEQ